MYYNNHIYIMILCVHNIFIYRRVQQRMRIFQSCLLKAAILDNEVCVCACVYIGSGKCKSTPGIQGIALYYYYYYYYY